MRVTGYCILVVGKVPHYRILYRPSLMEAIKVTAEMKKQGNHTEVLRMVDNDTYLEKEDITNEYSEDGA